MGVNRIVLDESVNRDFLALKKIQNSIGDKIELIANAICYKNCIYRMFHYNQMSCDSMTVTNDASINYYSHKCIMKRYENIANILKLSWIRPEDIKYYTDIGIHFFKLQGRQAVLQGDPVRAVECYFKESYDGDLLELLDMFMPTSNFRVFVDNKSLNGFILPYIKNDNFCSSDCKNCNYCESFAKKAIDLKKAKEITEYAQDFYTEYDQFSKLIHSDLPGIKVEKAKKKDKIKGFNFGK
jgi:collagenase-like PrtC family protease